VRLIEGNSFSDHRGIIRFVNDFNFDGIKRFYTIQHKDTKTIRAWQGHKLETKYFYVAKGSFLIGIIKIDDWEQPSKDIKIQHTILSDSKSELLMIPSGNANGFKTIEPDSILVVFSDKTLEESKADDFRWDSEYFTQSLKFLSNKWNNGQ